MSGKNSLDAQEVHQFINVLSAELRLTNRPNLAERLERVNKFYLFPLTSEFLGKAMVALRSILAEADSLRPDLKARATAYLAEIQKYFPASPGASNA